MAHLNIHTTLIEECAYFTLRSTKLNVNFFGDFETTLYVSMYMYAQCACTTRIYIYSTLRGRIKGTASAAFVIQNRF